MAYLSSWLQPVDRKDCLFLVCKSIPLHRTGSSTNFYICDTLVPLNSTKTCTLCCLHNFRHSKPRRKHSVCFTEYISKTSLARRISQIRQIFFHQMHLCSEFTKVSLHMVCDICYMYVHTYSTKPLFVTGPAKIDHVSAKKSPIFSVFAVS